MSLSPYSVEPSPSSEHPEQVRLHDHGRGTSILLTSRAAENAERWLGQGWTPSVPESFTNESQNGNTE